MIHPRQLFAAFALLIIAGSQPCLAGDVDQFDLSPEQLFSATVTSASKTEETVRDAAAAIYVLGNEDIRRSGATSIPEALRLVPGVQVARTSASGWAISIRGFNSALANKLLVLMDGREVYDPLFSGVYWDIQETPLEDIERIEIIRGPGASLWGANAVNGVINIITKKASDTQGMLVSAGGGTQPQAMATLRYGGKAGDGVAYRVYGKYADRNDEQRLNGADAKDGQQMGNGGFRADWTMDGRDSLTLQGDAYHNNEGQFRTVPMLTAPYAPVQEEHIFAHGGNILGRWTRKLQEDSSFSLQGYLNYSSRQQQFLKDSRLTFDLDGQYELAQLDRHKIVTGGHFRASSDSMGNTPQIIFANDGRTDLTFSGFVQDKITLQPKTWFLTLGTKLEHNDYSGFEIQPDARVTWNMDDTHMVWGSVSRAVRVPSRLEQDARIFLAAAPPSIALPLPVKLEVEPSPGLVSEEVLAYEMGYRQQFTPKMQFDFTAFFNDYKNLATFSGFPFTFGANPLHVIFPLAFTNSSSMQTHGFEAVLNWEALEQLKFSGAYSLLEMVLHAPSSTIPVTGNGQSPEQQFNLRTQWDVTHDVAFDTTFFYNSVLGGYRVPDYWNLDARLGWKVTDALQFDLVGQNLIEDVHREFTAPTDANAAQISRSFYGKFTWRY